MPAPLSSILDRFGRDLVPPFEGRIVIPPPLRAVVLAGSASRLGRPVLGIVPGEREAEELAEDAALFGPAFHLPAWETLPFEHVSPSVVTMADRVVARHALASAEPVVVVASVRAAMQRVSPTPVAPIILRSGDDADGFESIVERLVALGYERTGRVERHGEFAVRGGIIDVFPVQAGHPSRLDFFGDEIEEIRPFSIGSQRSEGSATQVEIYPAGELLIDPAIRERAAALTTAEF